ncbi:HPr kinase/phosphorylase [Sulfitobacter donghicola]|uniref:HPr kinase n=1 Tax=Sulfitobacter donghicola DSW-25 = KCTC 12864 = JCM 14565 TaxID=1300350 RepID=A0A073INB0_9RHOB|nr:HPr kinase/phosphatase C-terminal domain-containing protein [Sulfitobacter donghicola]KEJ91020.1 HPr kinase [Sulfitobacter donghicola DSW-25 = KCTC 12864 = JCM 14565]KIN68315.1 HPr kinase/phosphorylase [Sulfitobacter donghicola DSW-25 = KCTC 12864 = JCM 14565]
MSSYSQNLHANCVAVNGRGILILGPSGSGKSALSLQLIALGAKLVSDDRTDVTRRDGLVVATCPATIAGKIEARGVGILEIPYQKDAVVSVVIDLSKAEEARLPQRQSMSILDITLPCLHKVEAPYFPSAILAYVQGIGDQT